MGKGKNDTIKINTKALIIETKFMTLEEIGAYILLLCYQAEEYSIKKEKILSLIPSNIWEKIEYKFREDELGYYNPSLRLEMDIEKSLVSQKEVWFEKEWEKYPKKVGEKRAKEYFFSSVENEKELIEFEKALNNYLKSERVINGYIKDGSTFFYEWRDWVNISPVNVSTKRTRQRNTEKTFYKCPACNNDVETSNKSGHRYNCKNQEYWSKKDEEEFLKYKKAN